MSHDSNPFSVLAISVGRVTQPGSVGWTLSLARLSCVVIPGCGVGVLVPKAVPIIGERLIPFQSYLLLADELSQCCSYAVFVMFLTHSRQVQQRVSATAHIFNCKQGHRFFLCRQQLLPRSSTPQQFYSTLASHTFSILYPSANIPR